MNSLANSRPPPTLPSFKSLSPEEQRLFRLYGKLPSRSDVFAKHLKERKYFDSGDYALSKAGKADSVDTGSVGSEHPVPENIPHLTSPGPLGSNGGVGSPKGVPGLASGPGAVPPMLPHQRSSVGGASGLPGAFPPMLPHQRGSAVGAGALPRGSAFQGRSPTKEGSFLHRETSANDAEEAQDDDDDEEEDEEDGAPEGFKGKNIAGGGGSVQGRLGGAKGQQAKVTKEIPRR